MGGARAYVLRGNPASAPTLRANGYHGAAFRLAQRSIAEAHSIGRGDLGLLEIGYLSSAGPRMPAFTSAADFRKPLLAVP